MPRLRPRAPRREVGLRAAVCLLLIWSFADVFISLGDHPLYAPDEGRYARTTQVMMETGDYIVPRIDNHPRLQKPPMVHWLQSAAMRVVGVNEWGARLPGAVCGALTAGLVLIAGWRWRGPATGIIAAILLQMMPLVAVVDRLAIIDPILSFFWLGATLFGYDAARPRHGAGVRRGFTGLSPRASAWAFWGAVALAVMAKGPIGLIPAGVLLVWVLLRRDAGAMCPGRWVLGMLLAAAPLALWVGLVIVRRPEAWAIWKVEIIDRATGAGDHVQPFYYYLPILLGGFFPATAMLPVIGWHVRFAEARAALRRGHPLIYLGVAVVVPLVILSMIVGKLATYILPLAGPVALIAAWGLADWLRVRHDHAQLRRRAHPARRLPDGAATIAILTTIVWSVLLLLACNPNWLDHYALPRRIINHLVVLVVPLGFVPLAAWVALKLWREANTRAAAMVVFAAAYLAAIGWALEVGEDDMTIHDSNRKLLRAIDDRFSDSAYTLSTYGFTDQTLSFYGDRDVLRIAATPEADDLVAPGQRWVLVADADKWRALNDQHPRFAARFDEAFHFDHARQKLIILSEPPRRR